MAQKALGAKAGLILTDSDVLIDVQRAVPAALQWMAASAQTELAVPGVVAMELIIGSRSGRELDRSLRMLGDLSVLWHTAEDNKRAFELIRSHTLSTGLGLPDFFVAAQALNQRATLYTFNLRHFQAIPGLRVDAPYER